MIFFPKKSKFCLVRHNSEKLKMACAFINFMKLSQEDCKLEAARAT